MLSLFRLIPWPLRLPVFYRLFARTAETRASLYEEAPLALAMSTRMKLLAGDWGHRSIAYTGLYEWQVTKRMAALARAGGSLIDVGANAGYYSLLWCALNRSNHVEAFEALPANIPRLRENIGVNGLGEHIRLHPFALGATNGSAAFEAGGHEQSGWGGIAATKSATTIDVPMRRLDDVRSEFLGPVTIKIDCEGADSWVIEGARNRLAQPMVRNVFFEVNEPRQAALGIAITASQDILKSLGYKCDQIDVFDWHASKI